MLKDTLAQAYGTKIKGDQLLSFLSKEELSTLLDELLQSMLQSGIISREPKMTINCPRCGHPVEHMLVKGIHYLTWDVGQDYEGQWLAITPDKSVIGCPKCPHNFTPEVVEELTRE